MRVLHVIDQASRQACPTTLAMLADALGRTGAIEQSVLLLGNHHLQTQAQAVGIEHAHRIAITAGQALIGWPGWRKQARQLGLGTADIVHCWTVSSFAAVRLAWPDQKVLLTLTQPVTTRIAHGLVLLLHHGADRSSKASHRASAPGTRHAAAHGLNPSSASRPHHAAILCTAATISRSILQRGADETAVLTLRPGIDMARIDRNARQTKRKQWGIDDGINVVALLSDPPTRASTITAGYAVGLAGQTALSSDHNLALMIHPQQRHHLRSRGILGQLSHPAVRRLIIADADAAYPWRVLPGCDLALSTDEPPDAAAGLSMLWAMAAGKPMVAPANFPVCEILEDRHSALLCGQAQPRRLAHQLTRLTEDSQLAWKLRDTARHEAYSFFSRQRYVTALTQVYQQLSHAEPLALPPMDETGGLRFMSSTTG